MILYHFTCHRHLASILDSGLMFGEVPISQTTVLQAVNLTTSDTPAGHGLKRPLTPQERDWDKTAVRIKVNIPSTDRNLIAWTSYRRRVEPRLLAALESGRKPRTWYLYFGIITPAEFLEVVERGDISEG